MKRLIATIIFTIFTAAYVAAQSTTPSLLTIADRYWMQPDVVYGGANNTALKLDIWYPRDNPNPTPTVIFIHGGGWIFGEGPATRSRRARSRTRAARCDGFSGTQSSTTSTRRRSC
jgi:acetyl esterase/lipase